MPIISTIGRRHPKVRALIWSIYALLTLGAVTMVYPFMIMLAGSTKSAVDLKDFEAIPRFLYERTALYRKHVEGLFNESLDAMNITFDGDIASFEFLEPPPARDALVADWLSFIDQADLPAYTFALGYTETRVSRTTPQKLREFKQELTRRFAGDIDALNKEFGTEFVGWNSLFLLPDDFLLRRNKPGTSPFAEAFRAFKVQQPPDVRYYFCVEGFFKRLFLKPQYTRDIAEYNRLHGTSYASYAEVRLSRRCPVNGTAKESEDWESFVRNTLSLLWVRVAEEGRPLYQAFLAAKYQRIEALNARYSADYAAFRDVPLIKEPPPGGIALSDWDAFISGWRDPDTQTMYMAPREMLVVHSVDFLFREFLLAEHGTIATANAAYGTSFGSFAEIIPPQEQFHHAAFLRNRKTLRNEFITRNYRTVLEYMLFHGRGILNTVIYCSLAIGLALLVNPLAAYAMSRYQMPTTYKILLFLLLTMAFPPMVTQIPVFLMLRELGLLNTFAALVLPGMANGYSIFLLKGFFDSLPRELYESASIDGANEWVMFWQITMTLSKPILAVIALNTFTMAYSNFMFALLLCQDERMWTLMVWLYQLQMRSGQGVVYASLIIAGIPTLLVFVFCQNIIMRGIVVPVEK